ncbi:MAG: hypothetical protein ACI4JW_03200 [Oscillospiraceae bacterium]
MKLLIIILLSAAVLMLIYSAAVTFKTMRFFFSADEKDAESSKQALLHFRNRLIFCYAVSVMFIIAAAVVKALT